MPGFEAVDTTERSDDVQDLVRRCRQGDLCAFTALFERFQDRIYDLAWAILRDDAEAEDAVQDTFLRVFERIDRYRSESSFETWLVAVAVNVCRDRLRRRKVRRALSLESLAHGPGGVGRWLARPVGRDEDPSAAMQHREQHHGLWALVDRLDERQRLALILRYRYGLSCAEVAEVLGLSIGTVYVYLSRGRQELRALIEARENQVAGREAGREPC
jgi:RNA polymerase sigma-70 factor (ECF subfamily)